MPPTAKKAAYRFTFGPWNISTGADPFGPPVRKEVAFASKIREYKKLGFDGVQFHDDDVVPADLIDSRPTALQKTAAKVKKMLDGEGLFCEFIAPRLWEHPKTIDGGYTSNSAAERKYAIERCKRAIDIANALGCNDIVLWLAREGTYIREAKDPIASAQRILDAVNALLEYDREHPHPRRDEAERADGPGVPADAGPLPGPVLSRRRPVALRRADRVGPLASWPASIRPTTWPMPCGTTNCGASISTTRTA